MNWFSGITWLAAIARRRRALATATADHGDMGTAFGLDACTSVPDLEDVSTAAAAPTAATRWDDRLIRRSGL